MEEGIFKVLADQPVGGQKTHSEGSLAKDLERLITEQKTHSEGSLAEDSEWSMDMQIIANLDAVHCK